MQNINFDPLSLSIKGLAKRQQTVSKLPSVHKKLIKIHVHYRYQIKSGQEPNFFYIYVTDFLFHNIPKKYKIYMWEGFLPFYDI